MTLNKHIRVVEAHLLLQILRTHLLSLQEETRLGKKIAQNLLCGRIEFKSVLLNQIESKHVSKGRYKS